MNKIACAVICKNEEACIGTMLASVSGCEKVVILDTGSEDKTKDVATKFPNVEFHEGYKWKDDFAHARNHVKDLVPDGYDWILSIDCDEVLQCPWSTIQEAVDAIDPTGIDGISVKLIAAGSDGKSTVPAVRLFKRSASWKGAIHEVPMVDNKVQYDSIEIEFGRSPAHDLDPDLDLRILQREHLMDPRNTRVLFYLAREYYDKRQFEDAQKHFLKYLERATFQEEIVEAMYLLAHSYWLDGKGNGDKARHWCGQAICRNPHFKGAIELMAAMSWEREAKRWREFAVNADNSKLIFVH